MIVCAVNSSVGGFAEFENVFLTGLVAGRRRS